MQMTDIMIKPTERQLNDYTHYMYTMHLYSVLYSWEYTHVYISYIDSYSKTCLQQTHNEMIFINPHSKK